MGIKGEKLSNESTNTAEVLLDRLSALDDVTIKKMFGGHGVFHEEKMFGMVDSKGQAYLKVDSTNINAYESRNAHQHGKMSYFSIPEEIMNDQKLLIGWARKSIALSK